METNQQHTPGNDISVDVRKTLLFLRTDDQLVADTIRTMSHREIIETNDLLRTLGKKEREFVAHVVSMQSMTSGFYEGSRGRISGEITVACHIAHIVLSHFPAQYQDSAAYTVVVSVANSISYVLRFPAAHLDWTNRENLNYAYGATLTILAGKDGQTYENTMWLGENHMKLLHLIPSMIEVSCERGYLELLLENDAHVLGRGVL